MTGTLAEFNQLTNAEEFFAFLSLPYDPKVVQVNRLHILQKFAQLKADIDQQTADPHELLDRYRSALQSAYELFVSSSAPEQKLFKVFQEKAPNVVLLSQITEE
ncbi:MAG TPA: nitrogenase stabilizing/protective protein [Cyanobacteria bacterium UBA8156]|jgi:nitrogenase-stabilizing/protective protein|nr:nitrogenase stabilizing/protective protein [Cyanobacteria bacterium UBA8156]